MRSKRQITLYTWMAGVVFVSFDIAIAAWGMGQRAEAACAPAPSAIPAPGPAFVATLVAPGLVQLHGGPGIG